jgi:hypothetical protein
MFAALPVRLVDEGIDWPAWITLGVIIATAAVALFAVIDARRTRHGQLLIELQREWTEPEMVDAMKLYGTYSDREGIANLVDQIFSPDAPKPPNPELLDDWGKLSRWANLAEAMGVMTSEKAITPKLVYKMWGGGILSAWPRWEKAIPKLQDYNNEPDTYVHFQRIAGEMRRISPSGRRGERRASPPDSTTSASSGPLAQGGEEPGRSAQ